MRLAVVTSPATDAGKTFVAAGVAEAAAARGRRVLFLDLDLAVGDAARVFGLGDAARQPHPTVSSWHNYPDPWGACLRSPAGAFVLPRPENPAEPFGGGEFAELLSAAEGAGFDLAVADLGADHRLPHWAEAVRRADVALLVVDCDEKALARVRRFLPAAPAAPPGGWVLVVNERSREGRSPGGVARVLDGDGAFRGTVVVPYFPGAGKAVPKTFPPTVPAAEMLLSFLDLSPGEGREVGQKMKLPNLRFPWLSSRCAGAGKKRRDGLPEAVPRQPIVPGELGGQPGPRFPEPLPPQNLGFENNPSGKPFTGTPPEAVQEGRLTGERRIPSNHDFDTALISGGCGDGFRKNFVYPDHVEQNDSLTQLPTRAAIPSSPCEGAVVFCDLNGFKRVNDRYGHAVGDRVLREFSLCLKRVVRPTDRVFRWGGDEFLIVLPGTDIPGAEAVAARVKKAWESSITARKYRCGVAVGVALVVDGNLDAAVAAAGVLERHPDAFLVLGDALASTLVDGRFDRDAALVEKLKELRKACPTSRVVLILGPKASDSLVQEIAKLGIYDIHRVEEVTPDTLCSLIETRKTFADYDIDLKVTGSVGETPRVAVREPEEKTPRSSVKEFVAGLARLVPRLRSVPMLLTPDGLVEDESATPETIMSRPDCLAIFVPASWGKEAVRNLRRDPRARAVPIVVVGGGKEFLKLGADRVVRKVTDGVVQEVSVLAERLRALWLGAETDQLTGCYTRRFWDAWLKEQIEAGRHFSVALLDIDHFKRVNDVHGHQAGDAVLAAFGEFLRSRTRVTDVVARYGGEEFAVGLPYTGTSGGASLIDRLRREWDTYEVPAPGGRVLKCTFSAGVAEYAPGKDVMAEADAMLYRAKEKGRNRVEKMAPVVKKVLLMGTRASGIAVPLRERGIQVTSDPADATCVVADYMSYGFAPEGVPLVVIGSGTVADFAVKRTRPDALVCTSLEEAVAKVVALIREEIAPEEKEVAPEKTATDRPLRVSSLTVLPGGRASEKGQVIREHAALYVVCPSRPALAGETAASIARSVPNAALVCAAANCTGALAVGLSPETLIMADWRVPGSSAPVEVDGVHVWPVDPQKFLDARESVHALVDQIRKLFSLVVVDCGGNLDVCSRVQKADGVMVLQTAGDLADRVAQHWLRNYGGPNVFALPPGVSPRVITGENGFVVLGGEVVAGVRKV